MKIHEILRHHPSITHPVEMDNLIKPLKKLGICYFSHARINQKGELTINASNPNYLSHYYQDGLYQYDLHNAHTHSGKRYFLWDLVTRIDGSEQLYQLGIEYGMCHTFSIIEQTDKQKDLYHFKAPHGKTYMNEYYLQHIDLLEHFVSHFKDHILINDMLNRSYRMICKPSPKDSGYFIKEDCFVHADEITIADFLESINATTTISNIKANPIKLPRRELQCAYYLLEGKTSKEISERLHIAARTVEIYFERLKQRFGSRNKIQLAHHLTKAKIFQPKIRNFHDKTDQS